MWSDQHRFAADAAVAALVGLAVVPLAATGSAHAMDAGVSTPGAILIALVMVTAMAWRRTRPGASTAVVYSTALIQILLGSPLILPADLVVVWSMWAVVVHGPRWAGRVALGGALLGSALVGFGLADALVVSAILTVAIALVFGTHVVGGPGSAGPPPDDPAGCPTPPPVDRVRTLSDYSQVC